MENMSVATRVALMVVMKVSKMDGAMVVKTAVCSVGATADEWAAQMADEKDAKTENVAVV